MQVTGAGLALIKKVRCTKAAWTIVVDKHSANKSRNRCLYLPIEAKEHPDAEGRHYDFSSSMMLFLLRRSNTVCIHRQSSCTDYGPSASPPMESHRIPLERCSPRRRRKVRERRRNRATVPLLAEDTPATGSR